jgi:hypothetical protein
MNMLSQQRLGEYNVIQDDAYLGAIRCFNDKDHTDPDAVAPLSGMEIVAQLVKNNSGGTLAKGLGVTYEAGFQGKQVDALSGANAICDGVVDPFIPGATVPDQAYFWIIKKGPCQVVAGTGGLAAGDLLQTAASGTFIDGTPGTNPQGHSGFADAAITAAAQGRVVLNLPFSAGGV